MFAGAITMVHTLTTAENYEDLTKSLKVLDINISKSGKKLNIDTTKTNLADLIKAMTLYDESLTVHTIASETQQILEINQQIDNLQTASPHTHNKFTVLLPTPTTPVSILKAVIPFKS